jgi:ADP-L-glycero-D-manno-heptose 6-epimerase
MIIITGGAGFIGSNLVAGLEAAQVSDLVVCDLLGSEDKWRNISKRGLRDVIPPSQLMGYLDQHQNDVKAIFHLGAISATTERNADLIVEQNILATRSLWKWCTDHGVRFIYASSAATYGDGANGFDDSDNPTYLSSLKPLNPYGWSKHMIDRRVSDILYGSKSESCPPQFAGLKFFNVYGPNEYHKGDMMSVMCKLYPQIKGGANAKLFKSDRADYEDGGQLRDFIYVADCVSVMLFLLENPKVSGLFNVGTGKARSFKDLALSVFAAAKIPPKITYIDMPDHLKGKYQYYTQATMEKLRAAGYTKPMTELEDGVADYVQRYMAQEDSYV